MAPPSFATLPTEIRSIILEFVCAEDLFEHKAYTNALNLCLVSRQIHVLTLPILYRHVISTGRSKVNVLSRTLREHPNRSRFVRHLFLSDRRLSRDGARGQTSKGNEDEDNYEIIPDFAFTRPMAQQERIQRRLRMHSWLTARAEILSAFEKSISHIVNATAPWLRSFTLVLYSKYDRKPINDQASETRQLDAQPIDALSQDCSGKITGDVLSLEYPRLRELTIREEQLSICRPRLKMPALHRMHLAGGEITLPAATLAAASAGCPKLSHIHWTVSNVTVALAEALEWYFGIRPKDLDDIERRVPLEESTVSLSTPLTSKNLRSFSVQVQRRAGKNTTPSSPPPVYALSDNDAYIAVATEHRLIALSHVAPTFEFREAYPQCPAGVVYPLDIAASKWVTGLRGFHGHDHSLSSDLNILSQSNPSQANASQSGPSDGHRVRRRLSIRDLLHES